MSAPSARFAPPPRRPRSLVTSRASFSLGFPRCRRQAAPRAQPNGIARLHSRGAMSTSPPAHRPEPADLGIGRLFWSIQEALVVGEANSGAIVLWNPAAELLF